MAASNDTQIIYLDSEFTTGPGARRSDCLACYEDIEADEPSILHTPCGNTWHRACMFSWVTTSRETNQGAQATCPMCRRPITAFIATPEQQAAELQAAFLRHRQRMNWETTLDIWRRQVQPQPALPILGGQMMVPHSPMPDNNGPWVVVPSLDDLGDQVGQDAMGLNPYGSDLTHVVHQPARYEFHGRVWTSMQNLSAQGPRAWRRFRFPYSDVNFLVPGEVLSEAELQDARESPPLAEAFTFRVLDSHNALQQNWGSRNIAPVHCNVSAPHFDWEGSTRQAPHRWEEGHWQALHWHRIQGVTEFRACRILGSPFVYFIARGPELPEIDNFGLGDLGTQS